MVSTTPQWQIPEGAEVVGADGGKIGKVIGVTDTSIVVEKGWLFPSDHYIPFQAINTYDGDTVYLNVTKDEALTQGWDQPLGDTAVDRYDAGLGAYDTTGVSGETDATLRGSERFATADDVVPGGQTVDATASTISDTDTLRVPVHEEELTAVKRQVERGQVRIDTEVITEERTLEVPVMEERVTVTRHAVDRDATADETAFEGGTINVPLSGEAVDVQKRVRVAEEVEIGKEAVARTEHVSGTVRREEVHIDDQSDVEVTDGTTGTTAVPRR